MIRSPINRTEASRSRADDLYKFIFFSLIAIVLIILEPKVAGLKGIRIVTNYALTPLHITVDWVVKQQASLTLFFSRGVENQQRIIKLEQENLLLKQSLSELSQTRRDNKELRRLLDYRGYEINTEHFYVARVIGGQIDGKRKEILLDLGSLDGIKESMVAIDTNGLLGQVIIAGLGTSRLLTITDPRHSVPVKVARNGDRFIIDGIGEDYSLYAVDLHADIDVKAGDILLTSGFGGLFPPDIPVAKVSRILDKPRVSLRDLYAKPLAKPHLAEFVIVKPGLEYEELGRDE